MPIHFAIQEIGVSRTTMYNWMQRKQVHWREKPSGRAMICLESLMQTHEPENVIPILKAKPTKNPPKRA